MDCTKVRLAYIQLQREQQGLDSHFALRSATSPKELATTYPSPDDHIRTLYDVLEHTVQRHPEVNLMPVADTEQCSLMVLSTTGSSLCSSVSDKLLGDPNIGQQRKAWGIHMDDICPGLIRDMSVTFAVTSSDLFPLCRRQHVQYLQVAETRTHIGSGLLHLGVKPGSTCGLYSVNHTGTYSKDRMLCTSRCHTLTSCLRLSWGSRAYSISRIGCCIFAGWMLVDAAIAAYSMISVPLYDTLGPDAVTYVCCHAELTVVACSIDVLDTLLKCLPDCPTVKIVVCNRDKCLHAI